MNWNVLAFILMLIAFPLIAAGLAVEIVALWWIGVISLALGSLIPPIRRFTEKKEEKGS